MQVSLSNQVSLFYFDTIRNLISKIKLERVGLDCKLKTRLEAQVNKHQ